MPLRKHVSRLLAVPADWSYINLVGLQSVKYFMDAGC